MPFFYTGVGSRETPENVMGIMEDAAFRLARIGFVMRSGKAGGADSAFQLGVQKYCESIDKGNNEEYCGSLAEVYIPWDGFSGGDIKLWDFWDIPLNYLDHLIPEQVEERNKLVSEIHPNYEALLKKRGAFAMHSRNMHQVLGGNILEPKPSSFCLYYAKEDKNGNPMGGTASAVNLSKRHGIRVLNLNTPERLELLDKLLTSMEVKRGIVVET